MGWFQSNWMWRLRGLVDRILMGVGSSRGRRSSSELRSGDVIDFWRVENIIENKFVRNNPISATIKNVLNS